MLYVCVFVLVESWIARKSMMQNKQNVPCQRLSSQKRENICWRQVIKGRRRTTTTKKIKSFRKSKTNKQQTWQTNDRKISVYALPCGAMTVAGCSGGSEFLHPFWIKYTSIINTDCDIINIKKKKKDSSKKKKYKTNV